MVTNKANTVTIQDTQTAKRYWLADNRGIIKRIAGDLGVSAPFVSDVLNGKRQSTGRVVEAKLAEHGAPGFFEQTSG